HRALECLSNHALHAAIAVSEATRQDWIRRTRLPADRVTTIHNGVAPATPRDRAAARQRLGLPPDGLILGSVGRLDYAKGFSDLIAATPVGGVPEDVAHGITGFLVPARDPQGFANSLRPLLTDPHLRSEMGRAAQHRVVQHFDVRTTVARTLDLYRDLLSLRAPQTL